MKIRRGILATTLVLATLAIPTAASAARPEQDSCKRGGPWREFTVAEWQAQAAIFGFTGPSPDENGDGTVCGNERALGTARFVTGAHDNETA